MGDPYTVCACIRQCTSYESENLFVSYASVKLTKELIWGREKKRMIIYSPAFVQALRTRR